MKSFGRSKGYTAVEVLFVAVITVMVMGAIISTWTYTSKTWTSERQKSAIRINLMKALETIKSDLKLSNLDYVSFYPSGSGPYSGISIPVAEADNSGFFQMDASGKISWDKTVIYHLYTEDDGSTSLRRTVIDPRDNTMSEDDFDEELEDVVVSGTGPAGTETDTGFLRDVESFDIMPHSPTIDFYADSSDPVREGKVVFGSASLAPGDHTLRFVITGKNDDSTGYDIGVDSIMIEPSGSVREAEYYASAHAHSGALTASGGSAAAVYDSLFGNQNYLEFDAAMPGDYLEISDYYDLWRESSFNGASLDNAEISGSDVGVVLEAPDPGEDGTMTWFAYAEAGDPSQDGNDGGLPGGSVPPVVIRTVVTASNVSDEGDVVRVKFSAPSGQELNIAKAYITLRDAGGGANGLANQSSSGREIEEYHRHQQLFFAGASGGAAQDVVIDAGSEVWSLWTAFPIRTGNDYLISMYIADVDSDECRVWSGSTAGSPLTYFLVGSAYSTMAGVPDWSAESPGGAGEIYISASMDIWETSGSVVSQIFDTTLSAPAYSELKWLEALGGNADVKFKARSSSDQYMAGASEWDTLTASGSNPLSLTVASERYIQFFGELSAEPYWKSASGSAVSYADYVDTQLGGFSGDFPYDGGGYLVTGMYTCLVDDVAIDWAGEDKICTVTGYIAKKNSYGQAKLLVDGSELLKTLRIRVRTGADIMGRYVTEENIVEVEPRNTGK